jgi:hypothetical protein
MAIHPEYSEQGDVLKLAQNLRDKGAQYTHTDPATSPHQSSNHSEG